MTQGSYRFVTSDRCIEIETVLFSLPAIVTFSAILEFEILALKGNRLSMNFRDRGLSSKDFFILPPS